MKKTIKTSLLLILILPFSLPVRADILELRYTIQAPLDSTQIETIAPIGDFNADGYGDLALGIIGIYPNLYSGVFLYYGGPAFDDQVDLIFRGLPQDTIMCPAAEVSQTAYGGSITALGDYDGDGYDDFAVGSPGLCHEAMSNGAVYIYFGSTSPDTTADIFIAGEGTSDRFGGLSISGDFNGDSYGDFLAPTFYYFTGQKVYIFLGSDPPNGQYDWKRDYYLSNIWIGNFQGGHDINDDGYDDFSWSSDGISDNRGTVLFFGGDPIDTLPYAEIIDTDFYLKDDISEDGVDDFLISVYENPPHLDFLCLGGDPFNTVPDYGIPIYLNSLTAFVFKLPNGESKFVMNDEAGRKLIFYNTGIPFDTTIYEFYYYGLQNAQGLCNIGDIDGIPGEEIALTDHPMQTMYIYSGIQTGVDDDNEDLKLPEKHDLISAYPNPFNSACKITVSGPNIEPVETVEIYDITGRLVERLGLSGGLAVWDASVHTSGVYFARVNTEKFSKNIKLLLIR